MSAISGERMYALNRAVAAAMRDGPAVGLALIDAILARGDLADYHVAHSARADLCRRLGKNAEAQTSYQQALSLTRQEPERRADPAETVGIAVSHLTVNTRDIQPSGS